MIILTSVLDKNGAQSYLPVTPRF